MVPVFLPGEPPGGRYLWPMLVSVAQLASDLDSEANRQRAVASVKAAVAGGAELVVLPEASAYGFGRAGTDLRPGAEPLDGPFVTELVAAVGASGSAGSSGSARSGRATVIAGMFEPAPDGRVFNTVVVLDSSGVVGRYRKLHLFDALGWRESDRVAPGSFDDDPLLVVEVGELRVGVLTCYDLRFPELARALVDRGATALAIPAAWVSGKGKAEQWSVLVRARAIESSAYAFAAAQPGPEYNGHAMVVDPFGTVLASTAGEGTDHVTADIAAEAVEKARQALPLENRRFTVRPRP